MPPPNKLLLRCSKCKVSETCPRFGSSPTTTRSGKQVLCRIVGGYGRIPVPDHKLSEESRARAAEHGPCLTIAEIPTIDPSSKKLYFETVRIFSQPILHPREKTTVVMDRIVPPHRRQDPPPRH